MFHEIERALLKKTDQSSRKRWFRDTEAECDLMIWETGHGGIERFQFWHQDALVEWTSSGEIKTGYVDQNNGAFLHYQSKLYRLHTEFDREIVEFVSRLLHDSAYTDDAVMEQIRDILNEIASRNSL